MPNPRGFCSFIVATQEPEASNHAAESLFCVPNLTHAVTLLRKGPVLSTPPVHPSMHSFLEPRESELHDAKADTTPQAAAPENNTLVNNDQLFSDESPSLYEQETAVLNNGATPMESLAFEDQPPGLRALDGQEHPTKNDVLAKNPKSPPSYITPKTLKKSNVSKRATCLQWICQTPRRDRPFIDVKRKRRH